MIKPITIAVASGKGGTGKTTIATNLAVSLAITKNNVVTYVDCDVEEPNGHIFLKPTIIENTEVCVPAIEVDETACLHCNDCGTSCRFSAIIALPNKVVTFPKLCHGCGGCVLACPQNALKEVKRPIGIMDKGVTDIPDSQGLYSDQQNKGRALSFMRGKLNIGEAMAPPVIRYLLDRLPQEGIIIIDAPPGTSCPVIETVHQADFILLVTEPTPFGLHDLKLAVEVVRKLAIPFGVIINRDGIGTNDVTTYCHGENIPVLLRIANDMAIAQAYSQGKLAIEENTVLVESFAQAFNKIESIVSNNNYEVARQILSVERYTAESLKPPVVNIPDNVSIKELVVISGKGGTGKTSIVASLFALAQQDAAIADCDVDAADLHLVLQPEIQEVYGFSGGKTAVIHQTDCNHCGDCHRYCRFGAIVLPSDDDNTYKIDPLACEGCGVCSDYCPQQAIEMVQTVNGKLFISQTRWGPMTHAALGVAQENSGKLVSLVRQQAKYQSFMHGKKLLLNDGSPGIGCPVIASVTGADMVLIVTEPTLSGLHDLQRVAILCQKFHLKIGVCINKVDINEAIARQIEEQARLLSIPVIGNIHYDDLITKAQINNQPVVNYESSIAAQDIRSLWHRVSAMIFETQNETKDISDGS